MHTNETHIKEGKEADQMGLELLDDSWLVGLMLYHQDRLKYDEVIESLGFLAPEGVRERHVSVGSWCAGSEPKLYRSTVQLAYRVQRLAKMSGHDLAEVLDETY